MVESTRMPVWALVLMHAIPAIGAVFFGWSIALVLLFYWLENLVNGMVWARAIQRHHDRPACAVTIATSSVFPPTTTRSSSSPVNTKPAR